jgi:hypothetical protein
MQIDLPRMISAAAELRREMAMRERLYPRWISAGTLERATGDRQLSRLRDAISVLDAAIIAAGGTVSETKTRRVSFDYAD